MSYRDRVSSPGPKKLLALDVGGIRGVITPEVLQRVESVPAEQLCAVAAENLAGSLRARL